MSSRPNVFPTSTEQSKSQDVPKPYTPELDTIKNISGDSDYEMNKLNLANEIYTETVGDTGWDAVEEMRKRTEEQIKMRDEVLKKNQEQTASYHQKYESAKDRKPIQVEQPQPQPKPQPIINSEPKSIIEKKIKMDTNEYIQQLSQPQFNCAFDVIPLPSGGKIYGGKKANLKIAYMTTADENILSSPNLLTSGDFLEILINRKILDNDIRYKDLHVGDRNAIMLWLRATSYGEMYPVTIYDEDGEPFETEIDLTQLKVKPLGDTPDENGYFDFFLPVSKATIKFKLLTVGDIDEIEKLTSDDTENGELINKANTYKLQKQIIEVNGNQNKVFINEFIDNMRVRDGQKFKEFVDNIESGVDLEIEVRTPRGGSVKTFLPLNIRFFWPNLSI